MTDIPDKTGHAEVRHRSRITTWTQRVRRVLDKVDELASPSRHLADLEALVVDLEKANAHWSQRAKQSELRVQELETLLVTRQGEVERWRQSFERSQADLAEARRAPATERRIGSRSHGALWRKVGDQLKRHPGLTARQLADCSEFTLKQARGALDQLRAKGLAYAERFTNPKGRPENKWWPTKALGFEVSEKASRNARKPPKGWIKVHKEDGDEDWLHEASGVSCTLTDRQEGPGRFVMLDPDLGAFETLAEALGAVEVAA